MGTVLSTKRAVNAHVGDWEHAETVRRRCPSGQSEALHSEWSARAQRDMWVNQAQSWDPLAKRGRWSGLTKDTVSATEWSGARVCSVLALAFGRYPLRRGWTLVREIRRWCWVGSDRKYDEAKQVSGETRSDLDWYSQGRKRRITREVADEKRSSRRRSVGSLVKVTKGKTT